MRGVRGVVVLLVFSAATLATGVSVGCGGSTPASAATPNSTPRAVVTTFVGKSGASGTADGRGSAARFGSVAGLAFDADGLLWAADAVRTVRTVTADAVVKTVAGKAGARGYRDAPGSRARFNFPLAVACGPQGDAFVLDQPNNLIRKVTPDGAVTTFAGRLRSEDLRDSVGGIGITSDAAGNLYTTGGGVIRKFTPSGAVSILAGKLGADGYADGQGSAARFRQSAGITCDAAGNLYVADTFNAVIRKVTPEGSVTTIAGKPGASKWRDGDRATARLYRPFCIACSPAGDLFVSDETMTIRMIRPNGSITTIAGKPFWNGNANGTGSKARFEDSILGLACDDQGRLFIAVNGAIRKLVLK
jgi:hypothetical protein